VNGWLSGTQLREVPAGTRRQEWGRAMVRFQQLSAPTAAKSVEDTTFYRYGRLLSRNEVGSEPSQWAMTPAAFHAANKERQKRFPLALLATATHDHKRGEDARARLAVLSEVPAEWEAALARWMRLNAPLRRDLDGPAPDAADEVMLYQTLVAAWPLGLLPEDRPGVKALEERAAAWLEKALREAKRHSSWAAPGADYEAACRAFLAGLLDPERSANMAGELAAFAMRVAPAGAVNGLAQTLLRMTCPGIPDLYQGTEYWDFSLVDPDNRRPVDFAARAASLDAGSDPAALMSTWRDGTVKQAVIARTLALRARCPGLFTEGAYIPLRTEGPGADQVLAFARVHEGRAAVVAVTRLSSSLDRDMTAPCVAVERWGGTSVLLPRSLADRTLVSALTGQEDMMGLGRLPLSRIFAGLPVALLETR